MAIKITVNIDRGLTAALSGLSQVRLDAVKRKQATEMLNRARSPGGTPVDSRELLKSSSADADSMGYTKEYAGHVEYGHRQKTRNGVKMVEGQRYLRKNADTQAPIYKADVENQLRRIMGK